MAAAALKRLSSSSSASDAMGPNSSLRNHNNSSRHNNSSSLSSIGNNISTHSASSCYSQGDGSKGNLVSITVRKDIILANNPKAKTGIKLVQDINGQVTVKNIASNGLFGDTELEVGYVSYSSIIIVVSYRIVSYRIVLACETRRGFFF
jgi:hypothetical protein